MAADIDLQDAQVAIGDANLLIKAADQAHTWLYQAAGREDPEQPQA